MSENNSRLETNDGNLNEIGDAQVDKNNHIKVSNISELPHEVLAHITSFIGSSKVFHSLFSTCSKIFNFFSNESSTKSSCCNNVIFRTKSKIRIMTYEEEDEGEESDDSDSDEDGRTKLFKYVKHLELMNKTIENKDLLSLLRSFPNLESLSFPYCSNISLLNIYSILSHPRTETDPPEEDEEKKEMELSTLQIFKPLRPKLKKIFSSGINVLDVKREDFGHNILPLIHQSFTIFPNLEEFEWKYSKTKLFTFPSSKPSKDSEPTAETEPHENPAPQAITSRIRRLNLQGHHLGAEQPPPKIDFPIPGSNVQMPQTLNKKKEEEEVKKSKSEEEMDEKKSLENHSFLRICRIFPNLCSLNLSEGNYTFQLFSSINRFGILPEIKKSASEISKNLKYLNLSQNQIEVNGFFMILNFFENLEVLHLSRNLISFNSLSKNDFSNALRSPDPLDATTTHEEKEETKKLRRKSRKSFEIYIIKSKREENFRVKELDLSFNEVGVHGFLWILDYFKSLKSLNLFKSGIELTSSSSYPLISSYFSKEKKNTCLKHLNLGLNEISKIFVDYISSKFECVEYLNIESCQLFEHHKKLKTEQLDSMMKNPPPRIPQKPKIFEISRHPLQQLFRRLFKRRRRRRRR